MLDFDGVISDSAREAFRVATETYAAMVPDASFADADPQHLYAEFLELMPLGNRAEDYAVALAALHDSAAIPDQAAYDAFKAGLDPQWLRDFHKRFYRIRADFSTTDPTGWRQLMSPYREFVELLRRRAQDVRLAIATAKDRRSVHALLETYGIDDLFPEGTVLDKEIGVSKAAHLEHLRESFALEFPEMTFVDDKVNHLDSVAPLGVRCVLAAWGYNGPREHRLAQAHGYLVCGLEDVEQRLFDEG